MTELHIVSHKLCPHAQRLRLLALLAGKLPGQDYRLTYLDYATLRQTVGQYSPNGELPVLLIDGEPVSTVTDAIAEYLNAVFAAGLLPDDPAARLRVREGERLAAAILDRLRAVFTARDDAGLQAALDGLAVAAGAIERNLGADARPGSLAHLGFVALAPLASLTGAFPALRDHALWRQTPRLAAFLDAYRADERVRRAQCSDDLHAFDGFFAMTGSRFRALTSA